MTLEQKLQRTEPTECGGTEELTNNWEEQAPRLWMRRVQRGEATTWVWRDGAMRLKGLQPLKALSLRCGWGGQELVGDWSQQSVINHLIPKLLVLYPNCYIVLHSVLSLCRQPYLELKLWIVSESFRKLNSKRTAGSPPSSMWSLWRRVSHWVP